MERTSAADQLARINTLANIHEQAETKRIDDHDLHLTNFRTAPPRKADPRNAAFMEQAKANLGNRRKEEREEENRPIP